MTKLAYYIDITADERKLIAPLEKAERQVCAGEQIFSGGDEVDNLFVVKHGWFYAYTLLPDGGRLLVRVYHAGDLIGVPVVAYHHHMVDLQSVTEGCLCPFPKAKLDTIIAQSPKITALLFTLAAREEVILVDTLRAASRMHPQARIAYLLLSLHARLKITTPRMNNRFRLPLTQRDIGDAVGLTNVTVSRAMSVMQENKLIEREKGDVILTNMQELKRQCDFQDRYENMDTSWFPAS